MEMKTVPKCVERMQQLTDISEPAMPVRNYKGVSMNSIQSKYFPASIF